MKIPIILWIIAPIFAIFGTVGAILKIKYDLVLLEIFTNWSLIITLLVVIFYVYFTYKIASNDWTPSARFTVYPDKKNPLIIIFSIQNHCKNSLECWCNINATVYGKPVSLNGFYGGEHPWRLQPHGIVHGNFKIEEILEKLNYNIKNIKSESNFNNHKEQLYLNIQLWYMPIDIRFKKDKSKARYTHLQRHYIINPDQPHYYDFRDFTLVLDV